MYHQFRVLGREKTVINHQFSKQMCSSIFQVPECFRKALDIEFGYTHFSLRKCSFRLFLSPLGCFTSKANKSLLAWLLENQAIQSGLNLWRGQTVIMQSAQFLQKFFKSHSRLVIYSHSVLVQKDQYHCIKIVIHVIVTKTQNHLFL